MTQENKVDLCGRLPYKVVVDYAYNAFDVHKGNYIKHGEKCILTCYLLNVFMSPRQNENGEYIKPYLRPMSSMTEEESNELESITFPLMEKDWDGNENPACIRWIDIPKYMDFILSHHFDYQGLIEKGLALEAPEGMYN